MRHEKQSFLYSVLGIVAVEVVNGYLPVQRLENDEVIANNKENMFHHHMRRATRQIASLLSTAAAAAVLLDLWYSGSFLSVRFEESYMML